MSQNPGPSSDATSEVLHTLGTAVPSTVPTRWYNLNADFPEPMPPALNPATDEPVTADDLAPLFAEELIAQEVSTQRYIDIPQAIREVYALWRPSPLVRARRLERELGTKAKIYYK